MSEHRAREVWHPLTVERSKNADGLATEKELIAARIAASAAAWDAARDAAVARRNEILKELATTLKEVAK